MRQMLVALIAGVLFGAGLAYSGMVDPQRVQGFLDIWGAWDPMLAFVMLGAIMPMVVAWLVQQRMQKPFADAHFSLPGTTRLDARLATGAVLFGAGWGIGGLCPGPAIAGMAIAPLSAAIFVIAMLAGMAVQRFVIK